MFGSGDMYPEMEFGVWEGTGMAAASGIFGVLLAVYLMMLVAALAFSTACYVLHSLGLYTVSKRRGIHHSWLAWIPFGNVWLLGSVSDQYQYVVKGKVKNRRKVMLWLYVAIAAIYLAWLTMMIAGAVSQTDTVAAGAGFVACMIIGVLVVMALAVILAVFQYMAYYDLFASCNPGNATLFLVLSIVFQVTLPFFVFFCRKKDDGMPPRKQSFVKKMIALMEEEEPVAEENEETVTEEGFAQPEEFEEE